MGLREWAVKPGELRALSRGGLLLFSARCAMRVEPWMPAEAAPLWEESLRFVVRAAFATAPACDVPRWRALSNLGARACGRLAAADEPLGQCMNCATLTLATAVEAAGAEARPIVLKHVIYAAKCSASIAAVWAHAGRVVAGKGQDAVELASTTTWAAIRADIAPLAVGAAALEHAADALETLRQLAPLWEGVPPPWATPPSDN